MPIYEFLCPQCKREFEVKQAFSETNSTTLCPKCYSEAQRLVSSFACKTGGNLQAAEKPFGKTVWK
jgi:putative FmdB family regulatory protein